jgi:hypothetical protein
MRRLEAELNRPTDPAHVDNPDLSADEEDRSYGWAEGQRTFHVRITPHDISGRRLLPA